jgi:hypothetical protein
MRNVGSLPFNRPPIKATVTASLLNVHLKPAMDGAIIGMLPKGAKLTVLSIRDCWAAISLRASGNLLRHGPRASDQPVVAYVSTTWLELDSAPPDDNVARANQFIGGSIFRASDRGNWAGYDITDYLTILRRFYAGLPMPSVRTARRVVQSTAL